MFIDVHAHGKPFYSNFVLRSYDVSELSDNQQLNSEFKSIGIHPWNIHTDSIEIDLAKIIKFCNTPSVLAIGECGLDKPKGPAIELQLYVLEKQAVLAENLNKPLIVHCVKAFDELIALHHKIKPSVPWIIHGFRKNKQLGLQLIEKGMKLSFGSYILKDQPSLNELLIELDFSSFFLESDEDIATPIQQLYEYVAKLRGDSISDLEKAVERNFEKVFQVTL